MSAPLGINLAQSLVAGASLIGLLGAATGTYGLTNPSAFSETLGVPVSTLSSESTVLAFVSFIAARNLGSGVGLLTLLAMGQSKAAGISLMSGGILTAFADTWVCSVFKADQSKTWGHAIVGVVMGGLGAALYRL